MERVLEPEYMDTAEESRSYAGMDHASANESVVEAFVEAGGGQGTVLDIGTGPGDIPVLVAAARPGVRVIAIDAAGSMLAIARERVGRAGLAARISLVRCDAKALPFADACFDGVISNTILHHIPEPVHYLREAARVLDPACGTLVIRDLYRPATERDAWDLVDLHAKGADECQRKLLFDSLHAALTLAEARELTQRAGLGQARVEMSSDRHYTITIAR